MAAVALVLEFNVTEGKRDAFLTRSREHRETVMRNEVGCLRFDVLASEDEPDKAFLYAAFANRSALETHFATSYTKQYLDQIKPMVAQRRLSLCTLAHG